MIAIAGSPDYTPAGVIAADVLSSPAPRESFKSTHVKAQFNTLKPRKNDGCFVHGNFKPTFVIFSLFKFQLHVYSIKFGKHYMYHMPGVMRSDMLPIHFIYKIYLYISEKTTVKYIYIYI